MKAILCNLKSKNISFKDACKSLKKAVTSVKVDKADKMVNAYQKSFKHMKINKEELEILKE